MGIFDGCLLISDIDGTLMPLNGLNLRVVFLPLQRVGRQAPP